MQSRTRPDRQHLDDEIAVLRGCPRSFVEGPFTPAPELENHQMSGDTQD